MEAAVEVEVEVEVIPGTASTQAAAAVAAAAATPATPATPSAAAQPSTVAQAVSPAFTGVMKPGQSSSDIKRLQQLLNSDPDTRISASGVGAPGNETDYYGSLTEGAVKRFQAKYGIVSSGTPETTGYGLVGPATRAKLAEVFAEGVSAAPAAPSAAAPSAPSAAQPSAVAASVSPVFTSGFAKGQSSS
ncbi:MAG: peptidoglycan-binding protein, partial [Parcubacteria group bacterium]|nr:peptidoglycan-binding protein [Parcubacteria group bacterium]